MKFLVDAQLPVKLCEWLRWKGHDVLHTSALPDPLCQGSCRLAVE